MKFTGYVMVLAASAACGGDDGAHHLPDAPIGPPDVDIAVDAPALPVTCGAPSRLDLAAPNVSNVKAATLLAGRFVVAWDESPNNVPMAKARVWDGTQFLPEQTLPASGALVSVEADAQGRGYATWRIDGNSFSSDRAVLDPGASTFGTSSILAQPDVSLAGLGNGAIAIGGGTTPVVSNYNVGTATWSAPQTLLAGNWRLVAAGASPTGKGAASWVDLFTVGVPLYVSTFDGAAWTAPATTLLTPTITSSPSITQTPAVYANGDVLIVYSAGDAGVYSVNARRFHVATGLFDAPVLIGAGSVSARVFIDAADRATIVYVNNTATPTVLAARDLGDGAGFTAPVALGDAVGVVAAMDRDGNLAVVLQPLQQSGTSTLRTITAAGATWTAAVPTGLGATNSAPEKDIAIAFDGAGHPVVFAKQIDVTTIELLTVVCQ